MNRLIVLFFLLFALTSVGLSEEAGIYRNSYWYSKEIIYLGPEIAMVRSVIADLTGTAIYYSLSRSKWAGAPELVDQTGDIEIEELVRNIRGLMYDDERKVILGSGYSPLSNQKVFFGFRISDDYIVVGDEDAIESKFKISIDMNQLQSAELVFRWIVNNRAKIFHELKDRHDISNK